MNNRIRSFVGLTVLSVLGVAPANAAPTVNPDTGHYYEVIASGPITWDAAQSAIDTLYCVKPDGTTEGRSVTDPTMCASDGILPHLATITSSREDFFVDGLRDDVVGDGLRGVPDPYPAQTWIGGFQDTSAPCVFPELVAADFQCGWQWLNSEGDFPGVNGGTVYSNWGAGEPNDAGTEDHLTLGRYGFGLGWNDEQQTRDSIVGYIVEWDVPRPLEDCELSGESEGCVTIEGHTLAYPAESIPPGETLSFNSFEFLDPRVAAGTCGTDVLTILGGTGIGPLTTYPMKIPAYLCGSPKFIIITVDTGGFAIADGTVLVTNDTITALPDNVYPDGGMSVCEDPIVQVPFTDGDPQYQDVVVWQTTDPSEMLEETSGLAPSGFEGAAGEFSHDCGGSTRSRTRGGSDFGIGFHIDFGPGYTWAGNSAGNFDKFVALTRYKLTLLQQSVQDAKDAGAIGANKDFSKMKNMVRNAIKNLDDGNYETALVHVDNFVKFVTPAKYNTGGGLDNFEGDHVMRSGNIEFMLRVKVIPYQPVL